MLKLIASALVAGGYVAAGPPADPPLKWRAILAPAAGAKVRGGVIAEAKGPEATRFTITLRDAPPNATLAWHMHAGTCESPGAVVGTGYSELHVGPGGTAEAAVTISVAPPATGNFVVQVHGSTGTPVSCGQLKSIGEPG